MKINYNDKPLKIFVAYVWEQKKLFLLDMACAIAVALIDLFFPYISRICMNRYLPQKLYTTFFTVMAIVFAAYVLKGIFYYIITVLGHRMGVFVEAKMRRDIFTHMQELSFSFYDRNRTGALMSRITTDLFDITELAHHGPENILICTLTIIGSLIVMAAIEWRLAIALFVMLTLCIAFTISQRVRQRIVNLEVKKKTAEINAAIESSISGFRTAKAFGNEAEEQRKFNDANACFVGAKAEYFRCMGLFTSGMEFSTSVMQVLVIALGGILMMSGKIDSVDLITFSLYVSTFVSPVRKLAMFAEQYMAGTAGFERFLEIMRTEPEIQDSPDAADLGEVNGEIEYRHVGFHYANGIPVLTDINLHVRPGQSLAVVGPSGGGKTTLCHLLPRFYDVTEGTVTVDGKDIRTVTQRSLRHGIGMIQQDVFMFAGTIRENIRYGRPDATDEEVVEAARRAEMHEEIMELPNGYDTYIGERGVMLSGGQKQRISIARVFLKNPKILILDEATSALDTVTEQRIQHSLEELSEGRTTVIIAHRLSTVKSADIIAVIDGERIIETGTHEELLRKNGEYAELCRAQSI